MDKISGKKSICRHEDSIWLATTSGTDYPSLLKNKKIDVDAVVIGGGIAGISTALFLKQAGLNVALIEADRVAKGVSGYTSGKITSQHLLIYSYLIDKFGFEMAKQYADANQAAIEKIAGLIKTVKIDCDFFRKTAYTYAETDETMEKILAEAQAAKSLGLPAYIEEKVPVPIPAKGAFCFSGQAQFHPRRYLLRLAEMITGDGSMIFEKTRAVGIKEHDNGSFLVITAAGDIRAKNVVIATNFPFYDKPGQYYARMEAGRIYSFAMKLKTGFPEGIFISAEKNIYSFRSQPYQDGELIIAGGQEHVTGKVEDTMVRFVKLFKYIRRFYDIDHIEFCWSSQDNNTIDMVPYIGRYLPDTKNIFIATGFNGWGMTHGTIAAMIIKDMILGVKNPWAGIYDPARFKLKAARTAESAERTVGKVDTGKIVKTDWAERLSSFKKPGSLVSVKKEGSVSGLEITDKSAYPKKTYIIAGAQKIKTGNKAIKTGAAAGAKKKMTATWAGKTDPYDKIKKLENLSGFLKDLSGGDGKITEICGIKVAVYKHTNKDSYILNPVCPHMGCLLRFNSAEKSWDCPCHGSRFNFDGKVLNSPAFEDLKVLMFFKGK